MCELKKQTIIEDSLGQMYFGTKGGGICVFDGKNMTNYTTREGLGDNFILSLLEDSKGVIWAGTEGYGLNKLAKDTIIQYTTKDGLSNDIIWSMVEDNNGVLWLGTEKGLNSFDQNDTTALEVNNFGKLDGLKGSDFYPNSVCLDDQNRLWWGTGKSLAMLNLNKYEKIKKPPILQITDIRVEQTFVDYRKLQDSIQLGKNYFLAGSNTKNLNKIKFNSIKPFTNCPNQLVLPYHLNQVTFYFSGRKKMIIK